MQDSLEEYLKTIQLEIGMGKKTEHTHRPALKKLIESFIPGIIATNEPGRMECGAPDFVVSKSEGAIIVGYIEAKDIGKSLDDTERSEQGQRYRRALANLMLTDYLEFRWYVDGEIRTTARLARLDRNRRLKAEKDGDEVITNLIQSFLLHTPEEMSTPKELAKRMARLTHIIRDIIVLAFQKKKESDLLRDLRKAFATVLIPELGDTDKTGQFADMFAQTIAYGLFAARCNHTSPNRFQRLGAAAEIPKTNPFLRKIFETMTGTALDEEPFADFVDDLVQLLAYADIKAILADFGKSSRREDPVVHFYETFLAMYNPRLRERRGVYYTPEPVVSYIVRSVDYLLRERYSMDDGFADTSTLEYQHVEEGEKPKKVSATAPRVLVLDPACGTGTFHYSIVSLIRNQFMQRDDAGNWSGFIKDHLLPRMFGFELLMAPYAVAHLKLGLQLAGQDLEEEKAKVWAYDFSGDERLGVYLTNTLEEAAKKLDTLFGPLRVITDEANAAARIKRDLPIMVVLGNPPYANFGRMNNGEWISDLTGAWKPAGEKKWNPDDYMKFMRWAQWRIEQTGAGILAFITNHSFLSGVTHRKMRESLMETFDEIFILDLHGNTNKKEKTPDGSRDINVFDIQAGVAISIFVKTTSDKSHAIVLHSELWGTRERKYEYLSGNDVSTTIWSELNEVERNSCLGSFYFYTPKAFDNIDEYCTGWGIKDIFLISQNGIKTDRDPLFIDFDKEELQERMETFYSEEGLSDSFRDAYRIQDSSSYPLLSRRLKTSFDEKNIRRFLYRPFDIRWLYYARGLTSRPAWEVMRHIIAGPNLGFITTRQTSDQWDALITKDICGHKSCGAYDINSFFPLYLYLEGQDEGTQNNLLLASLWPRGQNGRVPNLDPDFVINLEKRLDMKFVSEGNGNLDETIGPEDILHYMYAIFYSPTYRSRYDELLTIDFPRIPFTSNKKLFRELCALGKDLVRLHLSGPTGKAKPITSFPIPGSNKVEKGYPKYSQLDDSGATGRVHINGEQYFDGVPPEIWSLYIGGYQVCKQWLEDRLGRELTYDDKTTYQGIVFSLKETTELMSRIDGAIPNWPIE